MLHALDDLLAHPNYKVAIAGGHVAGAIEDIVIVVARG
jgi:hypothetical protein